MRRLLVILVLGLGLSTGITLVSFTGLWQNNHTFWTGALQADPHDIRALVNLGVDAIRQGDYDAAEGYLDHAAQAPWGPDGTTAYDYVLGNLVALRLYQGRVDEARTLIRTSPAGSRARQFCPQWAALQLCEDQ